jgi:hypothetical protein
MGMGKFTIRYGQIYKYITGASANTSAGESTNPDPEVIERYKILSTELFTITNLRLHNWSQRNYKRWRIYGSGSGGNETI